MRYLFTFIYIILLFYVDNFYACTTVIISGKNTTDGRPVLWKHRDTNFYQNKLMFFSDGKFEYIGLVNSVDKEGREVWGGFNSTGFAIINSASYNLNVNDTTKLKDQEGVVMKKALQVCSTINDFENLLTQLPKPLGVEANFGVIDANGGAAYYETTNFEFRKFDVNDPELAPNGYIVRTNYSETGEPEKGYGYIRFQQAEQLFSQGAAKKVLNAEYVINHVTRDLKHGLTGVELSENLPGDEPTFVSFQDFIPRKSSVADVLIQGVKVGENPEWTMMWTILGFQLNSVAVPVWLNGGSELPKILVENENGVAPLCDKALQLKEKCFPKTKGSGYRYINFSELMNKNNTGIMQKLKPVEQKILNETKSRLDKWRKSGLSEKEIQHYYKWVDSYVLKEYQKLFGI